MLLPEDSHSVRTVDSFHNLVLLSIDPENISQALITTAFKTVCVLALIGRVMFCLKEIESVGENVFYLLLCCKRML